MIAWWGPVLVEMYAGTEAFGGTLITSEEWLEPTLNSVIIALGAMVFTMLLVVPAAFGYVRYRFRGKSLVNLLIMAPLIVPMRCRTWE